MITASKNETPAGNCFAGAVCLFPKAGDESAGKHEPSYLKTCAYFYTKGTGRGWAHSSPAGVQKLHTDKPIR